MSWILKVREAPPEKPEFEIGLKEVAIGALALAAGFIAARGRK